VVKGVREHGRADGPGGGTEWSVADLAPGKR